MRTTDWADDRLKLSVRILVSSLAQSPILHLGMPSGPADLHTINVGDYISISQCFICLKCMYDVLPLLHCHALTVSAPVQPLLFQVSALQLLLPAPGMSTSMENI